MSAPLPVVDLQSPEKMGLFVISWVVCLFVIGGLLCFFAWRMALPGLPGYEFAMGFGIQFTGMALTIWIVNHLLEIQMTQLKRRRAREPIEELQVLLGRLDSEGRLSDGRLFRDVDDLRQADVSQVPDEDECEALASKLDEAITRTINSVERTKVVLQNAIRVVPEGDKVMLTAFQNVVERRALAALENLKESLRIPSRLELHHDVEEVKAALGDLHDSSTKVAKVIRDSY